MENEYEEDEEDVEYEEYEEEVDEEDVDDEFDKMVQSKPQMVGDKAKVEVEEEDEEYEEEEVDEEYDEEEYDQVANKIDELLNKTSNLKEESKQNRTEMVDKLSSIEQKQPQANKPSTVNDSVKNDPDYNNDPNVSNLSKLRHASNKWDISALNDDETIPYDSGRFIIICLLFSL